MSRLVAHLRSPQLSDGAGNPTGSARVALFVAPGRPRWLGYLFYAAGFILGLLLALGIVAVGGEMGQDLVAIIGVVGMVGAVLGAWEVWRGRPLSLRDLRDRLGDR